MAAYLVRNPLSLKKLVYLDHIPRRGAAPHAFQRRVLESRTKVDPLVCTRCAKRMSVAAFVSDSAAVRRILDHLGLSGPEAEKPPPLREALRVAEQGDGWGVPAQWEPA